MTMHTTQVLQTRVRLFTLARSAQKWCSQPTRPRSTGGRCSTSTAASQPCLHRMTGDTPLQATISWIDIRSWTRAPHSGMQLPCCSRSDHVVISVTLQWSQGR